MGRAFFIAFGLILLSIGPVRAQNSFSGGGMALASVLAAIESEGLSTRVIDAEAKKAAATFNGVEFELEGYYCSVGDRCTEYLFSIGFDLPNGFPLTKINEWNAQQLAGRAFLDDEDDPWIDHVISVGEDDDASALIEGLRLWIGAIVDFDAFLTENETPAV